MKNRISITTSTFAQHDKRPLELLEEAGFQYTLNPFGRKLDEKELIEIIGDSVGIIAGTENLDARVLSKLPWVKAISRCGIGLDNIDLEAAEKQSIIVTKTTGSIATSVAELAVGLVLSLLRKTFLMDRQMHQGRWNKMTGSLLSGKNVGIVGFGWIGQTVAGLLKSFDVDLRYYDINKNEGSAVGFLPFYDLLSWSDIICVHVSKSRERSYIIDRREIEQMKDGAWLINCARGGVVNEQALYDALKSNKLAGAAIDVFEQEPYKGPLAELEQCLLTPHVGSYVKETRIDIEIEAINNLLKSLRSVL
jgi:D-3-phosphoglycerate dehydrogenase / 2-oxoglutarate reductase